MLEEKAGTAVRWMTAMAVILVPLSTFFLLTASYGYNFPHRQWSRYILFASWALLGISVLAGLVNMIGPLLAGSSGGNGNGEGGERVSPEEEGPTIHPGEKEMEGGGGKGVDVVLAAAQAVAFGLGFLLYVGFICILLLPVIPLQG